MLQASTPCKHAHDYGLEWLRDICRRMFKDAGGDVKNLGYRYRVTQSEHPKKTFAPRDVVIKEARRLEQR